MDSPLQERIERARLRVVLILFPLLALTAAPGLFFPAVYEGLVPEHYIAESRGQDFVTLFLAVPLLLLSLLRRSRDGMIGALVAGGTMGYTAYISIIYAYGGVANELYFGYVACLGLSVAGVALSAARAARTELAPEVIESLPRRSTSIFLLAISGLLCLIWGGLAAAAIAEGSPSEANTILVTDLALVIPAFILGGVWLWKKRPEGVIVAGMMLVLNVVLNGSIVAGQLFRAVMGIEPAWGLAGLFTIIAVVATALAMPYLRRLR